MWKSIVHATRNGVRLNASAPQTNFAQRLTLYDMRPPFKSSGDDKYVVSAAFEANEF